jgi:hypothetical protein
MRSVVLLFPCRYMVAAAYFVLDLFYLLGGGRPLFGQPDDDVLITTIPGDCVSFAQRAYFTPPTGETREQH